jgi:adenine-specific DNA-methyltransferase
MENTIFLGSCMDLFKQIPDNSVDLIVSSPPYNIGKEYETRKHLDQYLDEQKDVLTECVRILKDTGSIFWQVGSYSISGNLIPLDIKFFPIFEDLGMVPKNRIIWMRPHGLHAKRKFSGRHETILWFAKTNNYKFNLDPIRVPQKYQNKKSYRGDKKGEYSCHPDGKNPGDIWAFRNVKHNHEEQTIHPCQFPEDLITRIVLCTTEKGDVVLDPYMGTGTVAVVAKDFDRNYLGAEIDEKYHEVAMRRISVSYNEEKSFANLKCLRKFIEKTGEDIKKYRFDVQVGNQATSSDKSKIYPEEHHLEEITNRLIYEEDAFICKINGQEIPQDPFKGGKRSQDLQTSLF